MKVDRLDGYEQRANELLDRYDLTEKRGDLVATLSKGMRQKLSVACAFVHEAKVRLFDEPMIGWKPDGDGVRVTTTKGEYIADRLVLSGGAWMKELVRELDLPLIVERQVAFWLEPDESKASYKSSEFPIFAHEFTPGILSYGFPRMSRGVKASIMHAGELTESPRDVRREVREVAR